MLLVRICKICSLVVNGPLVKLHHQILIYFRRLSWDYQILYSIDSRNVTPQIAIDWYILQKTLLKSEIPQDCYKKSVTSYTFLEFFVRVRESLLYVDLSKILIKLGYHDMYNLLEKMHNFFKLHIILERNLGICEYIDELVCAIKLGIPKFKNY